MPGAEEEHFIVTKLLLLYQGSSTHLDYKPVLLEQNHPHTYTMSSGICGFRSDLANARTGAEADERNFRPDTQFGSRRGGCLWSTQAGIIAVLRHQWTSWIWQSRNIIMSCKRWPYASRRWRRPLSQFPLGTAGSVTLPCSSATDQGDRHQNIAGADLPAALLALWIRTCHSWPRGSQRFQRWRTDHTLEATRCERDTGPHPAWRSRLTEGTYLISPHPLVGRQCDP